MWPPAVQHESTQSCNPTYLYFFFFFRNDCVSPINQLLCALRFYATGCFQSVSGDLSGLSTSTAHRIVHKVSCAIASKREDYIIFPETPEEIKKNQLKFYDIARFPRVVGAIDCTHIRFSKSPGTPNLYTY